MSCSYHHNFLSNNYILLYIIYYNYNNYKLKNCNYKRKIYKMSILCQSE